MRIIFTISIISIFQPILSQSISGIIKDKETGEFVPYAHVSLKGRSTGTVTNSEGIFKLAVDKINTADSLKISHISYATKSLSIQLFKQNEENAIELQPIVVSLNEVAVTGRDPFEYFSQVVTSAQAKAYYPFSGDFYYREIVKDNAECSKYSDALLNVNYTKSKDDISIGVEQARVIQLPKETDDIVDIASPIDVSNLFGYQYLTILNRFQGDNRSNYNYSMYGHAGQLNTYTIEIAPVGKIEKNKILYFAEIVVENERIKNVSLRMDTTRHWEKSLLGVSLRIADLQISLSFNNTDDASYLSFGKMYLTMNFDHKKFNQKNEYQSEFVLMNVELNQLKTIEKKQRLKSKTIYKHGDTHFSNFWEGINIPIQSKMDNQLIEQLKTSQAK